MAVDGVAAARTLLSYRDIKHGMCLFYVWSAYKAHGARADRNYATALDGWNGSAGKHPGDWNPPAGVPVWFGAKPSSVAGDVVISLGGGRVACTDYPVYGVVGTCTIAERQRQIARPYLGWTETILGAPVALPGTAASGAKPVPAPPAPLTDNPEEEMRIINWTGHYFSVGREAVKYENHLPHIERMAHMYQPGTLAYTADNGYIDALQLSLGIPWRAFEITLRGQGFDNTGDPGVNGNGRYWSRQMEILAAVNGGSSVLGGLARSLDEVQRILKETPVPFVVPETS